MNWENTQTNKEACVSVNLKMRIQMKQTISYDQYLISVH